MQDLRIINLMENTQGHAGCVFEHGLSFYVQTEKHRLLVDAGPSENFMKNAQALGIDLGQVDALILSHGHYDHSGGILPFAERFPKTKIYMQKTALGEYYAFDGAELGYRYIGIDKRIGELPQVVMLDGDTKLDEELSVFLVDEHITKIPSTNRRILKKVGEEYEQDDFRHEQALVVQTKGRRIVLSGCAHNGILNVMEEFRRKFGGNPDLVVSGFHLMKKTEYRPEQLSEIEEIAKRLLEYEGTRYVTCHCTGIPAYELMKKVMGERLSYVHAGEEVMPWWED